MRFVLLRLTMNESWKVSRMRISMNEHQMELQNDFVEKIYGNVTLLRKNKILARSTQRGQIKHTHIHTEKNVTTIQIHVIGNAPRNSRENIDGIFYRFLVTC